MLFFPLGLCECGTQMIEALIKAFVVFGGDIETDSKNGRFRFRNIVGKGE